MENSKYNLRSYQVGYEVPFLDLSDQSGMDELKTGICNSYKNWFDTLVIEMPVVELSNTNQLMLYHIVVLVDNDLINPDTLEADWEKMKTQVNETIENFLKSRNLIYRKIS